MQCKINGKHEPPGIFPKWTVFRSSGVIQYQHACMVRQGIPRELDLRVGGKIDVRIGKVIKERLYPQDVTQFIAQSAEMHRHDQWRLHTVNNDLQIIECDRW